MIDKSAALNSAEIVLHNSLRELGADRVMQFAKSTDFILRSGDHKLDQRPHMRIPYPRKATSR